MATSELRSDRTERRRAIDAVFTVALVGIVVAGLTFAHDRFPESLVPEATSSGEAGRRAGDGLALASYGTTESYAHVRVFDQVRQMSFLSNAEVAAYRAGGAATARVTVASTLPAGKLIVLVVRLRSPGAATTAVRKLDRIQVAAGMRAFAGYHGVRTVRLDGPGGALAARAHYSRGELVVRLQLAARSGQDPAAALVPLLRKQLEMLPPDD